MTHLSPDQRNALYLQEAERVGIHKSILAALYEVHHQPQLEDGETGLGISPANQISLAQVNHLPGQVEYAANTIRAIADSLTAKGWQSDDLWDADRGRYTKKLITAIAEGYVPFTNTNAARLEVTSAEPLWQAYTQDLTPDFQLEQLPQNLAYLDAALLTLVDRIPGFYSGLAHQRQALLEAVRIWRKLDTREAAILSLNIPGQPPESSPETLEESLLDQPLLSFAQNVSRNYLGYPHQREALIRLTQLWRQLDSREAAIASLATNTSPDSSLARLDPALLAFVQRIPQYYQGKGSQRHALTEAYRFWHQLDSRSTALSKLGIDPELLNSSTRDRLLVINTANQLDRQLLDFIRRIPSNYTELDHQREALIRLVQLWRGLVTREQAINTLLEDLKRMNNARPNTPEAAPAPVPIILPRRPDRWTPQNIQIHAAIIPNSVFTWADATHGGTRMPPNQATVDAIVRIARLAQQARDRLGRPIHVTSWYRPPDVNARVGGVSNSRHIIGDAIDFYCEGLNGNQIYWFLDPWWPGGLGRYSKFPYLSHIDARSYRARWLN